MTTQNNGSVRLTSETIVRHFAEITVNGQNKGKREINGTPTLKEFAKGLAKEFGLTSFNVIVDFGDGAAPLTQASQAERPASDARSVGVAAKDSRASADSAQGETAPAEEMAAIAEQGEAKAETEATDPGDEVKA